MRAAASGSGTGTTRAGAFECRTPRYQWRRVAPHVSGVEHQVVVGKLDRADPPAREGLGHRHLELADRAVRVEAPHPRVGHRAQRIGVVHEVRGVDPRRVAPRRHRAVQRRLVASGVTGTT